VQRQYRPDRGLVGPGLSSPSLTVTRKGKFATRSVWPTGSIPGNKLSARKISGHTQFVTFARYVNINEPAARKGAERLAEYIAEVGASESLAMVH